MFDRAKQEKRKRRMHENMDIYKSQQISRLRERCKNQVSQKSRFMMFILHTHTPRPLHYTSSQTE